MSVTTFFTQQVTLSRKTGVSRDAIGAGTLVEEVSAPVMAYLEPTSGEEDTATRNTQIGDWLGFLPAGTDVDGWDRLVYGSHTFDIVSVEPFTHPTQTGLNHIRLRLVEVI